MNKFISKIKYHAENSESEETLVLCIEADTYGAAEIASYGWAEENLEGLWVLESIVKSQIKEVHKDVEDGSVFFLVKYEFGLEAKPSRSNIIVTDFHSCQAALHKATAHLDQFASGVFVTAILRQDIKYFLSSNTVKSLLGTATEEQELMQL